MFFHILNLEREIYWQIGSIKCAAYPLSQIDTIDVQTGHISKTSALNLVVFWDKDEHLELMDGVLIDLSIDSSSLLPLFFDITSSLYSLRPGPPVKNSKNATNITNSTLHSKNDTNISAHLNVTLQLFINVSHAPTVERESNKDDDDYDMEEWWIIYKKSVD
ncbi:hypothetical protein NQ317_017131 [Molorchus minor]|uniref:Uncharacterized protein n=1 Tax=Molorchus minor TaxID=1323400 RepID=A0ABQ9JIR2_9CUCU|nr:hypothetical protein NQ317_017131 [Molorchus minor]